MTERFIPTIPETYQTFLRSQRRLFTNPRELTWSPEEEVPIRRVDLSNGVSVDSHLTDNPSFHLSLTVKYPIGTHDDPASHLIEHLIAHPSGIRRFEERARRSGLEFYGHTYLSETEIQLVIRKTRLASSLQESVRIFEHLSHLLLGMTVFPEITQEKIDAEISRMGSEYSSKKMSGFFRLHEFIIPLVALNRKFTGPTFEEETSFDEHSLKQRHALRPHQGVKIWVGGNPRTADGQVLLTEALEKTFGQIRGNRKSPFPRKAKPKVIFPYGRLVDIEASYPVEDHVVGILLVVDHNGGVQEKLRKNAFRHMLGTTIETVMPQEGLAYGVFAPRLIYESSGLSVHALAVSTQTPEKALSFLRNLTDSFQTSSATSRRLRYYYQTARAAALNEVFQEPSLDRIEAAEKLGLPIARNAAALYNHMQKLTLEQIINTARSTAERVGFFHYGPSAGFKGFTQLSEAELERNWLAQPSI